MCVIFKHSCLKLKHRLNTIFYSVYNLGFFGNTGEYEELDFIFISFPKPHFSPREKLSHRNDLDLVAYHWPSIPAMNRIVILLQLYMLHPALSYGEL